MLADSFSTAFGLGGRQHISVMRHTSAVGTEPQRAPHAQHVTGMGIAGECVTQCRHWELPKRRS